MANNQRKNQQLNTALSHPGSSQDSLSSSGTDSGHLSDIATSPPSLPEVNCSDVGIAACPQPQGVPCNGHLIEAQASASHKVPGSDVLMASCPQTGTMPCDGPEIEDKATASPQAPGTDVLMASCPQTE